MRPNDQLYRLAKSARQGKSRLDPVFGPFAEQFRQRFGVGPLWLKTDCFKASGRELPRPRLGIVLERTSRYKTFFRSPYNPNQAKQREIADLFVTKLPGTDLRSLFAMPSDTPSSHSYREDIHVSYSDFEEAAKEEAHDLVMRDDRAAFTVSLGLGEQFWCCQRLSGPPIVFVHTASAAAALATSPVRERWADAYFEIVKAHDEFNYLERAEIAIRVDSKENFDMNYSSNWYYYFK